MLDIKCPPLDASLIRYLESVFPDMAVDPDRDDPKVHYGSIKVIRHLKAVRQAQEEDPNVHT